MTTIVINESSEEGRSLMNVIRAMQKSSDAVVNIYDDATDAFLDSLPFEPIPGFPYTDEDKIASVRESMEDVRAGRIVSMEYMRAKYPTV